MIEPAKGKMGFTPPAGLDLSELPADARACYAIATLAFPGSGEVKARHAAAARLFTAFAQGGGETARRANFYPTADRRLMLQGGASLERRLQIRIRAGEVALQAIGVWVEGGPRAEKWTVTGALREKADAKPNAEMNNEHHRCWLPSIPVLHLSAAFCRYIKCRAMIDNRMPMIDEIIRTPTFLRLWLDEASRLRRALRECSLLRLHEADFLSTAGFEASRK